jgi:hypothetical protein
MQDDEGTPADPKVDRIILFVKNGEAKKIPPQRKGALAGGDGQMDLPQARRSWQDK